MDESPKLLRRLAITCRVLVILGAVWTIFSSLHIVLFGQFQGAVPTDQGFRDFQFNELTWTTRIQIMLVMFIPGGCWLIALSQIWFMAGHFLQGRIFNPAPLKNLERFGWILVAMGVANLTVEPLIASTLNASGLFASASVEMPIGDPGDSLDLWVAAALIALIARFFRYALDEVESFV